MCRCVGSLMIVSVRCGCWTLIFFFGALPPGLFYMTEYDDGVRRVHTRIYIFYEWERIHE